MKARNKREREVERLSNRCLPPISEAQKKWMFDNAVEWKGYRAPKSTFCTKCGKSSDNSRFSDDGRCPECGAVLDIEKVRDSRKRKFEGISYATILTVCHGWQVVRIVQCKTYGFSNGKYEAHSYYGDVIQYWCRPGQESVTMGRALKMSPSFQSDPYSNNDNFSIKDNSYRANLYDYMINWYSQWMRTVNYPRMEILDTYRKCGFRDFSEFDAQELFTMIFACPYFERLYKEGKFRKLHDIEMRDAYGIVHFWPSFRIAFRHGYRIDNLGNYIDYLAMLKALGRDMRSPHYLCPEDFGVANNFISRQMANRMAKIEEKRRLNEEKNQLERNRTRNERYVARMSRYFGIMMTDGEIEVQPLRSVDEFLAEGEAMHHCVYSCAYYERADSLILSARINGERLETVEVSLSGLKVVQCYGKYDKFTALHDRVVALVNANMGKIRSAMAKRTKKACTTAALAVR